MAKQFVNKNQRPRIGKTEGKPKGNYYWSSICGIHYDYRKDCNMCNAGYWVNRNAAYFEGLVYKIAPWLWRWWVNRPNSKARKRIKGWFPNLK